MIDRRALLLALLVLAAGVAMTAVGAKLRPGSGDPNLLGLYGPAEGRYDAASDTTLLVRGIAALPLLHAFYPAPPAI